MLFQQHNPDYIPEDQGGPAITVADSENGNLEEYQREDGGWVQTWEWSDEQVQWPRDADRLPNGNTLITDSHGNRVIEVNPDGKIVWEGGSIMSYEAERPETGEESTGGESAQQLGLESRIPTDAGRDSNAERESGVDPFGVIVGVFDEIGAIIESLLPHRIYNVILFISPMWMTTLQFAAIGVGILTAIAWIGFEHGWQLRDAGIKA